MKNEPEITFVGDIHSLTMYENTEGIWVIKDHQSGVATQGDSKLEALLMMSDALAAYEEADEDLIEMAEDVFIPDDDIDSFES